MGKITFAIDCDEVLRALISSMVSLYNREFNENITYEDVTDFMVDVSFPKVKVVTGITGSQWFFQDNSEKMFLESDILPKVKEAIDILKKYGEVIIVTYQKTYKNKAQTLKWLEKHDIIVDGICFLKDKTLIHCDYFIDDNDWNFKGCNCKHGILITAPYNENINLELLKNTSNCETISRFNSLYDFAKNYEKNNKKLK